ncbi:unnamed protein product [Lymnaea stagnalis]|uniref:Protein FAM114A2 n=1 Tax=Lymnaea stagnalis TaxID=6523 RepID=A0AAV2I495_LYMST
MSESEEEAAFASADEGEEGKARGKKDLKEEEEPKQREGVGTDGDKKLTIQQDAAKVGGIKGKGKQQPAQKNKKKGSKSSQPLAKETQQPVPKPVSPPKSSPDPQAMSSTSSAKSTSSVEPPETDKGAPLKATSELVSKGGKKVVAQKSKESISQETSTKIKSETLQEDQPTALEAGSRNSLEIEKVLKNETVESLSTAVTNTENNSEKVETKQAADVRKGLQSSIVPSPEKQDIPRGEKDHTAQQEEVLKKLTESVEKTSEGGWGWSSWGSSILTAATQSVQTFSHQVGDGFSTIIDSVESSLSIPDPEELVRAQGVTEPTPITEEPPTAVVSQPNELKMTRQFQEEKRQGEFNYDRDDDDDDEEVKDWKGAEGDQHKEAGGGGCFSSWGVADLAKKVTDKGKSLASKGQTLMAGGFDAVENLASSGIDVLESIGKKTYNTLSEHDPAFRKTREFLSPKGNKPNLSSVLRDARDKAELESEQIKENEEARKAHFGTLFDDYQGIAHLEALEMLSNQSEKKVHSLLNSLSSQDLAAIKPLLISIKATFELKDDEDDSDTTSDQDFNGVVSQCLTELELGTAPDKLNRVHDMVKRWILDFDAHETHDNDSLKEVHQRSIQALAEITAKGVEQLHKAGELVLLDREKEKDFKERAQSLARLTGVLCHEIGNLATQFAACLNKMADKTDTVDEITPLVTNVYLEATNSSTYIQDAFLLLLPVLQHAAIEHSILSRQS